MDQSPDASLAIVAACPLFRALSGPAQEAVAAVATLQRFPPGATIFIEHQECTGLWILGRGRIKLHHTADDGREHIMAFPSPGAPLLLWAVMDQHPLTATATTLCETAALFIPRPAFIEIVRHEPALAGTMIGNLCAELRARDIGGGVAALKDARERLACRIMQLARQFGVRRNGALLVRHPLTRQDLGGAVGVTLETAIRAISQWRREGLLETQDQMIEIYDLPGLQQRAGCDGCLFDCSVFGPTPALAPRST